MSDGGKGDKPRPIKDWDKFEENWDKIFGEKPVQKPKEQNRDKQDKNS